MAHLFTKVSFPQYFSDVTNRPMDNSPYTEAVKNEYERITLPVRATPGSAGYDFYLPTNVSFHPNMPIKIFTGIRVLLDPGYFLMIVPRSSLGFSFGMRLMNTAGIIDSDYANGENEGHIIIKVISENAFCLHEGDRFAQGIILPYGVTADDAPGKARVGGVGSTGK